jgi:O-antigen/teichoic acid export membrane protein
VDETADEDATPTEVDLEAEAESEPESEAEEEDSSEWGGSIKDKVLRAMGWTLGTSVAQQGIRFISNLTLTRILFPEAFGLMAIVNAILIGVEMLSDLGLGPAIIRNPNLTHNFLSTLWSVQVSRGWILFAVAAVGAYPVSLYYEEPMLAQLIPAMGLINLIYSHAHTSEFTLQRDLRLKPLFVIDTTPQLVTFVVSVAVAFQIRSVWALVIGGIAGGITRTALTYIFADRPPNRWLWDKQVIRETVGFSGWITLSTMLTFATSQGSRLVFGAFAPLGVLGVFSIATTLADVPPYVNSLLANNVLFPLYSKIGQETTPDLRRRIAKAKVGLLLVTLPPLLFLTVFGDLVLELLWDDRYSDAGPMVQILSGGATFMAFSAGPMYLVRGEAWIGFLEGAFQALTLLGGMIIGATYFGTIGLVWGVALSYITKYPFELWVQIRYGIWIAWIDVLGISGSAAIVALGFYIRHTFQF